MVSVLTFASIPSWLLLGWIFRFLTFRLKSRGFSAKPPKVKHFMQGVVEGLSQTWVKYDPSAQPLHHVFQSRQGLGPPVVPFYSFLGEGSPSKTDYRQKGTLILTSLLEDVGGSCLQLETGRPFSAFGSACLWSGVFLLS